MKKTLLSLFAVASLSAGASYAVDIDNANLVFSLSYTQVDNTKPNLKIDGRDLANILLTYDASSELLKSPAGKQLSVNYGVPGGTKDITLKMNLAGTPELVSESDASQIIPLSFKYNNINLTTTASDIDVVAVSSVKKYPVQIESAGKIPASQHPGKYSGTNTIVITADATNP